MGIAKLDYKLEAYAHTVMGLIILITVGLVVLGGFATKLLMNNLSWRTQLILKMKFVH